MCWISGIPKDAHERENEGVAVGVKYEWGWKGSFSFQNLIRTLVRIFRIPESWDVQFQFTDYRRSRSHWMR